MRVEENKLIFSTGRTEYANSGIVGLGPDLCLSQGYDGDLPWDLTKEERLELADFMISLWNLFKEQTALNSLAEKSSLE